MPYLSSHHWGKLIRFTRHLRRCFFVILLLRFFSATWLLQANGKVSDLSFFKPKEPPKPPPPVEYEHRIGDVYFSLEKLQGEDLLCAPWEMMLGSLSLFRWQGDCLPPPGITESRTEHTA